MAKKNNIDIRFKVNDLSGIQVAPIDLVIIIGNLLDNAIEACVKLPAGEREIYAQLLLEDTLFLSFRNTSPPVEIVNSYIAHDQKAARPAWVRAAKRKNRIEKVRLVLRYGL